jgi:hypothetical protein
LRVVLVFIDLVMSVLVYFLFSLSFLFVLVVLRPSMLVVSCGYYISRKTAKGFDLSYRFLYEPVLKVALVPVSLSRTMATFSIGSLASLVPVRDTNRY